jgi:hypothetical protein
MCRAFDDAWAVISSDYARVAPTREEARLNLADALLSVTNEGTRDVETLKLAALQVLRIHA